MNKIIDFRIIVPLITVAMTIGCQKGAQPSSANPSPVKNIESKIVQPETEQNTVASIEKHLQIMKKEYDSLSGRAVTASNTVNDTFSIDWAVKKLSGSLFMETDPQKIFTAISTVLYDDWKITFEKNDSDPGAIFPDEVIKNRRGTCLGMSLVVLVICEKLGFPVYGVMAPGHFFVRFDNGTAKRNFETLRKGEAMPESWYRMKWSINDTVRYSLKNCNNKETVAAVYYTLGNAFLNNKKYGQAIYYYKQATTFNRELIEASGNMALACEAIGNSDGAISILSSLAKRYPSLENIHSNLAALYVKASQFENAETEYKKAIETDSTNAALYLGLAVSLQGRNNCDSSLSLLMKALELKSDFADAQAFKKVLDSACAASK